MHGMYDSFVECKVQLIVTSDARDELAVLFMYAANCARKAVPNTPSQHRTKRATSILFHMHPCYG